MLHENTSMEQVTLTGNPHSLCVTSELPLPCQLWAPARAAFPSFQAGTPFLWDWHWGEAHPSPLSRGAAPGLMSCTSLGASSGAGQRCCWGGCVYLTVESTTEHLVFLRGCCRSLKCAIGTGFVKEHLFPDESPYLGVHSYFSTINSGAELTSLGTLRACSSQPGQPIVKPLPMNVKIVFPLGASNSSSCWQFPSCPDRPLCQTTFQLKSLSRWPLHVG